MGLLDKLLEKLRVWLCKRFLIDEICGIGIADVNCSDPRSSAFRIKTRQALDLIRTHDPRRFLRVQKYIRYIRNTALHCAGKYCSGNMCELDFGRWDFSQHPEKTLYGYAAVIVHEATHGYLRAKGFGRTKRNWMQLERICRSEENRFLSRLAPPMCDHLQRPFNPGDWDFGSPLARVREVLRRRKEIKQSGR